VCASVHGRSFALCPRLFRGGGRGGGGEEEELFFVLHTAYFMDSIEGFGAPATKGNEGQWEGGLEGERGDETETAQKRGYQQRGGGKERRGEGRECTRTRRRSHVLASSSSSRYGTTTLWTREERVAHGGGQDGLPPRNVSVSTIRNVGTTRLWADLHSRSPISTQIRFFSSTKQRNFRDIGIQTCQQANYTYRRKRSGGLCSLLRICL